MRAASAILKNGAIGVFSNYLTMKQLKVGPIS